MMAWGGTTEEANEKLRKATEEVNARNRKVQREYLRSNPDARRSEVLDRFARRKGYDIAAGDPGVAPKGSVPGKKRGVFQRGHADPDFIRAHEAGHVAQNLGGKNLPLTNISRQAFMLAPLGAASALVNKDKSNDKVATGIASFVTKPNSTITSGTTMAPPPTPAIVQSVLKNIKAKIPPISYA